jgi:hypothetical protein
MASTHLQPHSTGDTRSACENRLIRMSSHLRSWSETIPELREATSGPAGIERIITRAEHVFPPVRDRRSPPGGARRGCR